MMVLGIDYGERYIGVAVGDTEIGVATPKTVVENRGKAFVLNELKRLIEESGVEQIVVGLPLNFKMAETPRSEKARIFAHTLRLRFQMPIDFENELLTTKEATQKTGKTKNHAVAAALILQSWLDKQR